MSEGPDSVAGGQMRGDKACHYSDATKYGRIWNRKLPEGETWRVNEYNSECLKVRKTAGTEMARTKNQRS